MLNTQTVYTVNIVDTTHHVTTHIVGQSDMMSWCRASCYLSLQLCFVCNYFLPLCAPHRQRQQRLQQLPGHVRRSDRWWAFRHRMHRGRRNRPRSGMYGQWLLCLRQSRMPCRCSTQLWKRWMHSNGKWNRRCSLLSMGLSACHTTRRNSVDRWLS